MAQAPQADVHVTASSSAPVGAFILSDPLRWPAWKALLQDFTCLRDAVK